MLLYENSLSILHSLFETLKKEKYNKFIKELTKITDNNINNINEKRMCLFFYNYMNKINNSIKEKKINYKVIEKNDINMKILNSYFISNKIRNYIKENIRKIYCFHFTIENKNIFIHIPIFIKEKLNNNELKEIQKEIKRMYIWLYICIILNSLKEWEYFQDKNCNNELNIYFFRTDFKKNIDKEINKEINKVINNNNYYFTPDNINSAYSNICNEKGIIVIYRKEEWFKIFIHETFHSFSFHPTNIHMEKINNNFKEITNIRQEILIEEAYSEFWARIINSMFIAFLNTNNSKTYYTLYKKYIQLEIVFSCIQAKKIYQYNNIKSYDFSLYKEKTNVFSYFILTYLFMKNYKDTIDFFYNSNINIIKSKNNNEYIEKYNQFIKNIYQKEKIDAFLDKLEINDIIKEYNGLRMSIIEI